jgi:hypothetical protein
MDIFLSGDIRKDKGSNGYILNPNHYPNVFNYSGSTLTLTSWPRFYNIVLDSFDYSNNFIERKNGFFDRGTAGLGFGVDFNFNNIGYKYNLYLSGSTNFTGFSGFTITNDSFSYADFNKQSFTINGLPNYTGLTITTATTLFGNVLVKLDIGEGVYVENIPYTANTFNVGSIILDVSNSYTDNSSISGLVVSDYELIVDFDSLSCVNFQMFDGPDVFSTKIYEYICDGTTPYNITTAFTVNLTSGIVTLYNSSLSDVINVNSVTINEINYNTITTYALTGNTKNMVQFNLDGVDFSCDFYKNNKRINLYGENGKYSEIIDFSGDTKDNTWVNFSLKSSDEVKLKNIKFFPLT